MLAILVFEINSAKKDKIFNFLKGCFFVMNGPIDIIFDMSSETYVSLLKNIILQFFSKFSRSYNNLNAKSWLKLNNP